MFKNLFYKISYLILCLISLMLIYNNNFEKKSKLILMTVLVVAYSIIPIKLLLSYIREYTYSKFIRRFLETEEKHYLLLSKFDDTYKAMLVKMEKVIEYKNNNSQSE